MISRAWRVTESVVLLAHTPLRLNEAAGLSLPLMLSGHTHGGQIVVPVIGAVAAASFPIVSGDGSRKATTAFVTRGVGTVYVPVRINSPPEVAILTLQTQKLLENRRFDNLCEPDYYFERSNL